MHTIVIIDALRVRDAPHTVWNAKHRRNLNCKMPMFYIRVPFGRESQLPFSHISPVGYFHIFFSRVSKVYFFFLPTYTVRVHSFFGHKFSFSSWSILQKMQDQHHNIPSTNASKNYVLPPPSYSHDNPVQPLPACIDPQFSKRLPTPEELSKVSDFLAIRVFSFQ